MIQVCLWDLWRHIFQSPFSQIAKTYGIESIAKIPMDPNIASIADKGAIELFEGDWLEAMADVIKK